MCRRVRVVKEAGVISLHRRKRGGNEVGNQCEIRRHGESKRWIGTNQSADPIAEKVSRQRSGCNGVNLPDFQQLTIDQRSNFSVSLEICCLVVPTVKGGAITKQLAGPGRIAHYASHAIRAGGQAQAEIDRVGSFAGNRFLR